MPTEVIERTHNVDVLNKRHVERTIWHDADAQQGEVIHMGIADAETIYSMLSDLSANKGAYVLREAWSNAYDATTAAGTDEPVRITLPDLPSTDTMAAKLYKHENEIAQPLIVEDHGIGMTRDEVIRYFLQYGGSNKRDDPDAIGSKGLGSKAPLAVTESFVVETTKDGITTIAAIRRAAGEAGVADVTSQTTGKPSGTRLSIPINDHIVAQQMHDFAQTLATYVTDIPLVIDGIGDVDAHECLPKKVGEIGANYMYVGDINIPAKGLEVCHGRVWELAEWPFEIGQWPLSPRYVTKYRMSLLIGGVPYQIPTTSNTVTTPAILIAIEPGWVDFDPSRDSIKDNQALRTLTDKLVSAVERIDLTPSANEFFHNYPKQAIGRILDSTIVTTMSRNIGYGFKMCANIDDDDNLVLSNGSYTQDIVIDADNLRRFSPDTQELFDTMELRHVHLVTSSPSNNNASCHVHLDKRSVPKSTIRHHITDQKMTEYNLTANDIAKNLHTSITNGKTSAQLVVTNVDTADQMAAILRHEADMRRHLAPKGSEMALSMSMICVETGFKLPQAITNLAPETPIMTFDEYEAACAEIRRKRRQTTAKQRTTAAQKTDPSIWQHQMAFAWSDIPYGDARQDLEYSAQSDREIVCNAQLTKLNWGRDIAILRLIHGHVTPRNQSALKQLAIVVADFEPEMIQRLRKAWASAVSRLAATRPDLIDPSVTTRVVLLHANKTTTKVIEALATNGATIVADLRPRVKNVIKDTVANKAPDLIRVGEHGIPKISATIAFEGDKDLETIWHVMTKKNGNLHIWPDEARGAVTIYDLVQKYADDDLQNVFCEPIKRLLTYRRSRAYHTDSYAWFNAQTEAIVAPHTSALAIFDWKEDIQPSLTALKLGKETYDMFDPIIGYTSRLQTSVTLPPMNNKRMRKLSEAIGPALAYNISKRIHAATIADDLEATAKCGES